MRTRELLLRALHLTKKVSSPEGELTMMGAMAKCFASDTAMSVTTDAVQLLGGYGYVQDFPVERMMRDAKITQIYDGTNQILRVVMARHGPTLPSRRSLRGASAALDEVAGGVRDSARDVESADHADDAAGVGHDDRVDVVGAGYVLEIILYDCARGRASSCRCRRRMGRGSDW